MTEGLVWKYISEPAQLEANSSDDLKRNVSCRRCLNWMFVENYSDASVL